MTNAPNKLLEHCLLRWYHNGALVVSIWRSKRHIKFYKEDFLMKFNAETAVKTLKVIAAVASAAGSIIAQFWSDGAGGPQV